MEMADQMETDEYRRIRVLWPDHLNLARGKYLPHRLAAQGTRHSLSVFALGYDRDMSPVPGTGFLEGMPDMECHFDMSDVRPGWEDGVGVVVGDLERNGEPVPLAPRTVLRNAVNAWESLGYTPKVGIELEAYIMEPGDDGRWRPYNAPGSFVYGTGVLTDPEGIVRAIDETAERLGFRVESINGEFDIGQFEMTLEFDDAMRCADEVFLFRVMAMEVAAQKGHRLTFMPRPIPESGGNGLHVNLSLSDNAGRNAMLDPSTDDGLSALAKSCIAGQLHHMSAMAALCAPTANSYKRLLPGQISGYWKNWGHDHRSATVRVNPERDASTRLENRMPDGAASTYSAIAAVLTASRLGVEAGLKCPDAETGDALETASTEEHTPDHLGAAIEALRADKKFANAIGSEMVDQYLAIKEIEWGKYLAANGNWEETIDRFTEWEEKYYLPYL